ncbi:hypothetical protein IJT17_10580, partial [bacterium]|nr:hypothetical protein [bacterium]
MHGVKWDLTPFLRSSEDADQAAFVEQLRGDICSLLERAHGWDRELSITELAEAFRLLEAQSASLTHIVSYALCRRAEDVHNEAAHLLSAQVSELQALYAQAEVLCISKLRGFTDEDCRELAQALSLSDYCVRRWQHIAHYSMDTELEALQAELSVTGFSAWERLYESIAGRLEFDYSDSQGEVKHTSMNSKVSLLEDPDPQVRRSTLENSNLAWQQVGDAVAACLNNIAGHRLKILQRRGVEHHLDNAAFEAGLERRTLSVMQDTAAELRPVMRDYLRAKAKLCNLSRMGFQDVLAPAVTGEAEEPYSWEKGCETVLAAFRSFSPEFADFASMALADSWIDSQERTGKAPGGFCTSSPLIEESRIFMTYRGNYGDVSTLAHEIGHAWHEWLLNGARQFERVYPMTLAETASTFAERVLGDYVLNSPELSRAQRLSMLMRRLDDGVTYLLNIP